MKIKATLVRTAVGVIAACGMAVGGAAPAQAASQCVPVGTFVGDITVTVCAAADTPPAGYPPVGAYVAPHGYVEVCRQGTCTTIPFDGGSTGAAVVPGQAQVVPTADGTPIPNLCVAGVCTPSALPGYQVVLFQDPSILILQVNGNIFRFDLPTTCVSTAGTC